VKGAESDCRTYVGNEMIPPTTSLCADDNFHGETLDDDCQLMPGIQLDAVRSFTGPHDRDIHVTPIIVDFRSLWLSKSGMEIIKGVSYTILCG